MDWLRGLVVGAVVVAGVAQAEKRTLILANGDCADPALISSVRDFRDAAGKLLGPQMMEGDTVLDIVRPRALRSLKDVERQLESARALFYGGQPERADEIADRVLEQLERATPDAGVWPIESGALVLKALIARNADRTRDMNEAFKRIVRVDPQFKLDPDAYPPSALTALEAVRKELARTRKATVYVRVERGPAAAVHLDGHVVGQTPLKLELVPGSYRVMLANGELVSFPHKLEVPRDGKLSVDFQFEGSVPVQAPLCLTGASDESAIKLAQLATAEQVLVLSNTAKRGEPPYISGALYNLGTGQQERTGSVQPTLMNNLATFLITGKPTPGIGMRADAPVEPSKPTAVVTEPAAKQPTVVADGETTVAPPPPPADVQMSTGRVVSIVVIGVGGAAALTGTIVYLAGASDRATFEALAPGGVLQTDDAASVIRAIEVLDRVQANQLASGALIAGGLAAAAAGVIGVVLFPDVPAQLGVAPSASGATVSLSGRF